MKQANPSTQVYLKMMVMFVSGFTPPDEMMKCQRTTITLFGAAIERPRLSPKFTRLP